MSFNYIEVLREERLTVVTINRPSAHNTLNAASHLELEAAFDAFENDDDQWVAIITGAGPKAFCAGHDLKRQADGGGLVLPPTGFGGLTSRSNLSKPIIAAVNGVAMGGGFQSVFPSTNGRTPVIAGLNRVGLLEPPILPGRTITSKTTNKFHLGDKQLPQARTSCSHPCSSRRISSNLTRRRLPGTWHKVL